MTLNSILTQTFSEVIKNGNKDGEVPVHEIFDSAYSSAG